MMKQIFLFLLLAVCSMSVAAQAPSKKCPTCGLSIPKCQYKGKHPKPAPQKPIQQVNPVKQSSIPQKGKQPERPVKQTSTEQQNPEPAKPTTGTINGHEWVDLGLSVKWATMNVGASSPSDYGDYFAWGETTTKLSYTKDNCKTWERSMSDIAGNSQYDAARTNWGSPWRLPTRKEFWELEINCTWEWENHNKGYRVTSKKNGNSIFLPAAGDRLGKLLYLAGEDGRYWSSTPNDSIMHIASCLCIDKYSQCCITWLDRHFGRSIRPVTE